MQGGRIVSLICLGYLVILVIGGILILQMKQKGGKNGKWYYYLPGALINMVLGTLAIWNWVIIFVSVTWGSDRWRIVFFCVGIYILLIVGGNIGIWMFFRKKIGFQLKFYAGCNLLSYAVGAIGYVMFMFVKEMIYIYGG